MRKFIVSFLVTAFVFALSVAPVLADSIGPTGR
jgi:hypothetical protein